MKDKALKKASNHILRITLGLCATFWILSFHPVPPLILSIILLVGILFAGLLYGMLIADHIIYKNQRREKNAIKS